MIIQLANLNLVSVFLAFVAYFLLIVTAILIEALQIQSFAEVLMFSALIGIGYLFANTVNIAINPNIPRPILYGVITGSYHLLGMFIIGMVIIVMK